MKNLWVLALVCLVQATTAQRTVEREVGDFDKIKVFDLIEVNLIPSETNKIVVKGPRADEIVWTNRDGVLRLRMELDKKFRGEDTFVEVYHDGIGVIDGNEGAQITSREMMENNFIELRAQEGARIEVGLKSVKADIRAVTGGIVQVSGTAEQAQVTLNTGGVFEGSGFRTEFTSVKVSAGGEAEVFAKDRVDINVKAGGDVVVYGQPAEVNKSTFIGGRVTFVD